MICYNPIPLFEASLFLANQAAGVSWNSFLERTFGKGENCLHSHALSSYSKILTELEQRLRASITVQDATLQKLYAPLYHKGNDQRHPSAGHVCSILLPGLAEAYLDWEAADFFTHLRQSLWGLPGRILEFLNPESCDAGENLSIQQLFQAINGSDLPQSSKLILTDLALNGEQYVDLLQDALTPVAKEFQRCQELISPLLEHFHNRYCQETEEAMMDRLLPRDRSRIKQIYIYPSVVCSNYVVYGFNADETVLLCCIGTLCEFLRENFAQSRNSGIQLTQTLSALSNRNRFNILTKLLDGPAYGRELASFVGLSPVTVSQHIGILMGAKLVTVHNDGARTYYSLNKAEISALIDSLKKYFRTD